jgi:transposase-like protein
MPAGRPTDYSDELADTFCQRIAEGRSVLSVCADLDMPAQDTIYRWRREKPEFSEKLAQARDERLEAYADRMMALGTRVVEEAEFDPQRCNAAVNAIDKAARLQAPKQRVELTGRNGGPIETADMTEVEKARRLAFALAKAANAES